MAFQRCERGLPAVQADLFDLGAVVAGVGADNLEHVRKEALRDEDSVLFLRTCDRHPHGFRGCGGAVVHGGIADVHAGEVADHALVLEDVAERALRNLALVGGVGGQELRTRKEVRDHGRAVVVVRTGAHEDFELRIEGGEFLEPVAHFLLGLGVREVVLALEFELGRHVGIEVVKRTDPYLVEHLPDIVRGVRKIREVAHYLAISA